MADNRQIALFILGILVLAAPSRAQRPICQPDLPDMRRCLNSPAANTTEGRMECGGREDKRQDTRLRAALAALEPDLSDWELKHLREVQKAWERWRELRCDYAVSDPDSGSEARAEANYCYATTTAERAIELQAMQTPDMLDTTLREHPTINGTRSSSEHPSGRQR